MIVDADLDWMLAGRVELGLCDLVEWLSEVTGVTLAPGLVWARVTERLMQNAAYAFRQIGVWRDSSPEPDYLDRKQRVLNHCCVRLEAILTHRRC